MNGRSTEPKAEASEPVLPGSIQRWELPLPVEAALSAVEEAAEVWGADFERDGSSGQLVIPVTAGLRRGEVAGALAAEPHGNGSRLRFEVERADYRVHVAGLVVLFMGAAGGLLVVVAPLFPPLLELLPVAGLLMLLAWFLVLARIRNRNAADFFALVRKVAEDRTSEPLEGALVPER